MARELRLGISPCPNDTFMFHELVRGGAPVPGVEWDLELLDIEALNRAALLGPGRFDVTKLSIPALAAAVEHYTALGSGAALGRGCGPLVVRRSDRPELKNLRDLDGLRVAIPGEHTTANLLLRIFGPANLRPVPLRFDAILTAIAEGEVDAGAIIHESRFTFADHGLTEISDLGSVWEDATDLPLPLGLIAARRTLGEPLIGAIEAALHHSVRTALDDPMRSREFVREHAQEMDEVVCRRHIALYVNDDSVTLSRAGRRAIDELLARGRAAGLLPDGGSPWR